MPRPFAAAKQIFWPNIYPAWKYATKAASNDIKVLENISNFQFVDLIAETERERERAGQQIGVNERMERPVYWPGPLSIVAAKSIFLFLVNICALSLRAGFKCQNRKITRAQTGKAL